MYAVEIWSIFHSSEAGAHLPGHERENFAILVHDCCLPVLRCLNALRQTVLMAAKCRQYAFAFTVIHRSFRAAPSYRCNDSHSITKSSYICGMSEKYHRLKYNESRFIYRIHCIALSAITGITLFLICSAKCVILRGKRLYCRVLPMNRFDGSRVYNCHYPLISTSYWNIHYHYASTDILCDHHFWSSEKESRQNWLWISQKRILFISKG